MKTEPPKSAEKPTTATKTSMFPDVRALTDEQLSVATDMARDGSYLAGASGERSAADLKVLRAENIRRANDSVLKTVPDNEFKATGTNDSVSYLTSLSDTQLNAELKQAKTPDSTASDSIGRRKDVQKAIETILRHRASTPDTGGDRVYAKLLERRVAEEARNARINELSAEIDEKIESGRGLDKLDFKKQRLVRETRASRQTEADTLNEQFWARSRPDYDSLESIDTPENAKRWSDADAAAREKITARSADAMSDDERTKIRDAYVVNDTRMIAYNRSLKTANPDRAAVTWANRTSKMINQEHTTRDVTVYRGAVFSPEVAAGIVPGAVISSKGFSSTDVSAKTALYYGETRREKKPGTRVVLFTVRVPKGHALADVDYGEMVLDRGSDLRVVTVSEDENGVIQAVVEVSSAEKNR